MCAQRLEELSLASSRLEHEVRSLRRAAYTDGKDAGDVSRLSPNQIAARHQQQQPYGEVPTKVRGQRLEVNICCLELTS